MSFCLLEKNLYAPTSNPITTSEQTTARPAIASELSRSSDGRSTMLMAAVVPWAGWGGASRLGEPGAG
eukprot:CAMPEP_0182913026 /NCGR_PEP_ID=MMETSP0034_2-20130328/37823_1 /TAXON_ID=156128 /ORGANISM="Nephroselmis pyriformis, Strain CCMP717" /LENGTH=67 /DNA_ID=CAMNT_0025049725 /DNA_START=90 /DNA_END=290 /DNA_ORIENTATION=+